jgi:hypothetical protein
MVANEERHAAGAGGVEASGLRHSLGEAFGVIRALPAMGWATFVLTLVLLCVVSLQWPIARVPAAPPAAPDMAQRDAAAKEAFTRFALNALLTPLIDDAEPPRWTDVALLYACGPATHVEVDGQAMVPGERVPATAFILRWTMDQCAPFESPLALTGGVELQVFHEDEGLSAIVHAERLTIAGPAGRSRIDQPFAATLSWTASVARQ